MYIEDTQSWLAVSFNSPTTIQVYGKCMHLAQLQRLQPQHHFFLHGVYSCQASTVNAADPVSGMG